VSAIFPTIKIQRPAAAHRQKINFSRLHFAKSSRAVRCIFAHAQLRGVFVSGHFA
jgi:hypothetical protein